VPVPVCLNYHLRHFIYNDTLTTNVRRHKVLVGERGSSAAAKSQTLILLRQTNKSAYTEHKSLTNQQINSESVNYMHAIYGVNKAAETKKSRFFMDLNRVFQELKLLAQNTDLRPTARNLFRTQKNPKQRNHKQLRDAHHNFEC